jgi:hypothetical protein
MIGGPRLASAVKVGALLRRVAADGGFGTVLARGDDTAGSIAIITLAQGRDPRLLAPVLGDKGYQWTEMASGESVDAWVARARQRDPDLWVVELDIPAAARLIAEMLGPD